MSCLVNGVATASRPVDETAIAVNGLSHCYGEGEMRRQVLFDLSLTVAPGEMVFLMGPSGCGKTTVLTLIGALRSIQEGSAKVLGRELKGASERTLVETRQRIGFIFQSRNLHRSLTALQNVRMGLEARGESGAPDTAERCREMLATVGLGDYLHKRQDQLSGGQNQRVAVARALVAKPQLVLADEPTAALDKRTGYEAVALLRALARERGMTVLMVTHDNRIFDLADRILEMEDGRIVSHDVRGVANRQRDLQSSLRRPVLSGCSRKQHTKGACSCDSTTSSASS